MHGVLMRATRLPLLHGRGISSKVDYYYAQAAIQITYWKAIQVHAVLPSAAGASAMLQQVAGLASVSLAAELAPFADATVAFHANDDAAADADFPQRVCFLPQDVFSKPISSLPQGFLPSDLLGVLTARNAVMGVHISMDCAAGGGERLPQEWQHALEATKAAKDSGLRVKVVLHNALAADPYDLSLVAANLCDAGADILTIEALGGDVEDDAMREVIEACCENDILGVPMMMRLGVRLGPSAGLGEDTEELLRVKTLVTYAARMGIYHFDTCPLGLGALAPVTLVEAMLEAGVESRLTSALR